MSQDPISTCSTSPAADCDDKASKEPNNGEKSSTSGTYSSTATTTDQTGVIAERVENTPAATEQATRVSGPILGIHEDITELCLHRREAAPFQLPFVDDAGTNHVAVDSPELAARFFKDIAPRDQSSRRWDIICTLESVDQNRL